LGTRATTKPARVKVLAASDRSFDICIREIGGEERNEKVYC